MNVVPAVMYANSELIEDCAVTGSQLSDHIGCATHPDVQAVVYGVAWSILSAVEGTQDSAQPRFMNASKIRE